MDFVDRDRVQARIGLTPAIGGCYPQSNGQPSERHPQLAFDLLSRRSKDREKYGGLETDETGFWESYGYHIRGDPWKEVRYS